MKKTPDPFANKSPTGVSLIVGSQGYDRCIDNRRSMDASSVRQIRVQSFIGGPLSGPLSRPTLGGEG